MNFNHKNLYLQTYFVILFAKTSIEHMCIVVRLFSSHTNHKIFFNFEIYTVGATDVTNVETRCSFSIFYRSLNLDPSIF